MSSTNKTTNYELSQFLGTDKPAWLSDYNGDMSKIDAAIYTAASTATGADGKADTNATAIGTLSNLNTTAKTNLVAAVNEVNTAVGTAQNTATNASTVANAAAADISAIETALNLGTTASLTWTASTGNIAKNTVKCVRNSDGSLAKIYGYLTIDNSAGTSDIVLTSSDTGLRPSTNITFSSCGVRVNDYSQNVAGQTVTIPYWDELIYTLKTNGTITLTLDNNVNFVEHNLTFIACLLFIKDFGD